MKIHAYLKDKLYLITIFIFMYLIMILMFLAFKLDISLIIALSIIILISLISILSIEYIKKNKFYSNLLGNIEALDQAYLVLETLENPDFIDGEILYQALYEINKSMNEVVKNMEEQISDFKDYIEMWIHEVKLPIASINLMAHNNKDKFDKKTLDQIKRIEASVEQVLYYVRSENAEKDYLINQVSLNKVIANVALKNKDDLLDNKIDLNVSNVDYKVNTDSKWLEFILNQIINNSIKYRSLNKKSLIKISARKENKQVILSIEDNGIGILPEDLPKVFNKTYTGTNGRIKAKSTGMGLYIAKNLCQKLGHKIEIVSVKDQFTRVSITISEHDYYFK